MTEYKLQYFNMMGRAEPTRLIFAYAGVQFKDDRIDKSEWPEIKACTFLEQPVCHFVSLATSFDFSHSTRTITSSVCRRKAIVAEPRDWALSGQDLR